MKELHKNMELSIANYLANDGTKKENVFVENIALEMLKSKMYKSLQVFKPDVFDSKNKIVYECEVAFHFLNFKKKLEKTQFPIALVLLPKEVYPYQHGGNKTVLRPHKSWLLLKELLEKKKELKQKVYPFVYVFKNNKITKKLKLDEIINKHWELRQQVKLRSFPIKSNIEVC